MPLNGVSTDDWYTMARTAWGEARGESFEGITAVCWTIVNRVWAHTWYGHNVYEVCTKPFQYSCWNADDPNRAKILTLPLTDPSYRRCLGIAALVLSSDLPDPTHGATHYYNPAGSPNPPGWVSSPTMVPTVTIGAHHFFREV